MGERVPVQRFSGPAAKSTGLPMAGVEIAGSPKRVYVPQRGGGYFGSPPSLILILDGLAHARTAIQEHGGYPVARQQVNRKSTAIPAHAGGDQRMAAVPWGCAGQARLRVRRGGLGGVRGRLLLARVPEVLPRTHIERVVLVAEARTQQEQGQDRDTRATQRRMDSGPLLGTPDRRQAQESGGED
jgi:hypothetical protein